MGLEKDYSRQRRSEEGRDGEGGRRRDERVEWAEKLREKGRRDNQEERERTSNKEAEA